MFDDLLDVENEFERDGHNAGREEAAGLSAAEGRVLGFEKGVQLGLEIGYYGGFARAWLQLQERQHVPRMSERVVKNVRTLQALADSFPDDPEDLTLDEQLKAIRGKFKQVSITLGSYTEFRTENTDF